MALTRSWSRRGFLGGALASAGSLALADAPLTSPRPHARNLPGPHPLDSAMLETLAAGAQLDGEVSICVHDMTSGEVMAALDPRRALPPASVAKAMTTLYAVEALGIDHRFATSVIATGPVVEGELQGDLVLAGGGDPGLDTDDLADLAAQVSGAGIRSVAGRFLLWSGALPEIRQIDAGQLPQLSYNPAICGLNLNFNRVYFEWKRGGADYQVSLDARSDRYQPQVASSRMRVIDRDLPVYTYADGEGIDDWTVARSSLGDGGSRWLPVRYPARYAGDVFRTLIRSRGITLPPGEPLAGRPQGREVARIESTDLRHMLLEMLKYSTNITAEAIGLSATIARGQSARSLPASAGAMSGWLQSRIGGTAQFVNHSGLSDRSRISAEDLVLGLTMPGAAETLMPLLKPVELSDSEGNPVRSGLAQTVAKTGTMNFVSALAGYHRTARGSDLAFAILTTSPHQRAAAAASQEEVPPGARSWSRRARRLQQDILIRLSAT